jgi:TctA family transporter
MIGMLAVISTTDTIPAILFGVPGSVAAQATVLDGHPMAKNGEAARALNVSYLSSILGGFIGAVMLALSIPVLRPLVLSIGSPEFFMIGLLGLTMVATLSSGSVVRGLLAAAIGSLLATVGTPLQSVTARWDFDILYLADGIAFVPLVLGVFAIPEIVELFMKGRIQSSQTEMKESTFGSISSALKDVLQNWWLVVRCSILGTWVGAVPGLGSAVVDWFAYGHAATTCKGAKDTFGKGDVRGVIAPESANNAKNGGELIPTIAFGIPGSATMAMVLGGLLHHNINPGPDMLTTHLGLTMTAVWSIPVANLLAGVVCLLFTRQVAKMVELPMQYIVPIIFVVTTFAAFQSSRQLGDLVVLALGALLGWFMKSASWPRPPLVLAFVLTPIVENYLYVSMSRYGFEWVTRPGVLILGGLIVAMVIKGLVSSRKSKGPGSAAA